MTEDILANQFDLINKNEFLGQMQLFALIRGLDDLCETDKKVGDENSFKDCRLRFGQTAFLDFPTRQINRLKYKNNHIKVDIKGFGLFGPNGALPIHITEQIFERRIHQKDQTFNDFVDMFHNRLTALFYKSWRDAQDIVSLDNEDSWHFSRFIASILGVDNTQKTKSVIHHYSQFYYSNLLLNRNMPLENIKIILKEYFKLPIQISENMGQWIDATEFKTSLSSSMQLTLGQGLLLGDKIFDATQKFRFLVGPISVDEYINFLPESKKAKQFIAWVEQYTHHQFQWDLELTIDKQSISQQKIGDGLSLGVNSWIGQPIHNPKLIVQY